MPWAEQTPSRCTVHHTAYTLLASSCKKKPATNKASFQCWLPSESPGSATPRADHCGTARCTIFGLECGAPISPVPPAPWSRSVPCSLLEGKPSAAKNTCASSCQRTFDGTVISTRAMWHDTKLTASERPDWRALSGTSGWFACARLLRKMAAPRPACCGIR